MRCRKCGREYADDAWRQYHQLVITRDGNGRVMRDNNVKVWDTCTVTVLEELYELDFPWDGTGPCHQEEHDDDCD